MFVVVEETHSRDPRSAVGPFETEEQALDWRDASDDWYYGAVVEVVSPEEIEDATE